MNLNSILQVAFMIKLEIGMINSIPFEVIEGHEMARLINRASFLLIDHIGFGACID